MIMPRTAPGTSSLLYAALITAFILILSGCTTTNSVLDSNPLGAGTDTSTTTGTTITTTQYTPGTTGTGSGTTTLTSNGTNQSPVVTLKVSNTAVGLNSEVQITAEALDPEGEQVTFAWTASGGTFISQNSNKATWKSPSVSGAAEITCSAMDKKGAKGTAKASISVIGGRTYALSLSLSRMTMEANDLKYEGIDEWIPLANAKVTFQDLKTEEVSNSSGRIELDLDAKAKTATGSLVIVSYRDWEVRYMAQFQSSGIAQIDQVKFYPGYDGISVAIGKGDSFMAKRGGVEVQTYQMTNGTKTVLKEVSVEVGTAQKLSRDGEVFMSIIEDSDTTMNISKIGYKAMEGLKIPVEIDGVTLIGAQMSPVGSSVNPSATISYTKPYNGQTGVSVRGPFEIGFSQAMERDGIFNDFEMAIQDSTNKTSTIIQGYAMRNYFAIEWLSNTILRLSPLVSLAPSRKYSLHVTRWNARAVDGRLLKNYASTFGSFVTALDQAPRVLATVPRNGDTGISRFGPFTLTFDQAMNPDSLTSGIQLEIKDMQTGTRAILEGAGLASEFSISWNRTNTEVQLVPRRTLKARNSYTVRLITSNLRSQTGKSLTALDGLWGQFTTGDL
jgi:hypothetical protein